MIITRNSTTPEALRETMSTTQSMFRVAAIQMASGPNVQANLQEAGRLIELAAATGARIIALPEYFAIMGMKDTDKVAARERDNDGPIQSFLSAEAKRHRVWIVGGSVPLEASTPEKVRNSCLVYDGEGKRVARYDKIHLFGFEMGQERYSEERTIEPGAKVCAIDSPYGRLGISVCYDLRFPELYRAMRETCVGKAELGRRLGVALPQIDRLVDLRHQSRLDAVERAFAALGRSLAFVVKSAA